MPRVRRVEVLRAAMGRRLKAARLTAGFEAAEDLADAIGQHPAAYRKYERGESVPPLDILEMIRERLEISVDWLFYGDGKSRRDKEADRAASEIE